jgi:hypothetical protein
MNRCEYVTIGYYPKTFNDEHINVAFALHDPSAGKMYFDAIRNRKRVTAFDDDISEADFASLLSSISRYFTEPFQKQQNFLPRRNDDLIYDPHFFDKNQHVFLNQFRLSKTLYCDSDNPQETFELLSKVALYYDREKKDRASAQEVAKAMKLQIENAFSASETNLHKMPIENELTHGESIRFDYRYKNYYIKVFNVLGTDQRSVIEQAKVWFYNASYFKNRDFKLIFVVPDEDIISDKTFSDLIFKQIFDGVSAEIVHSSDFAHLAASLKA